MIATESHRPLRILFVSHTFPPVDRPLASVGGMQRVAVELHKTLEDRDDIQIDTCVLRSSWRWAYVRTPFFLVEALGQVHQALEQRAVDVMLFSSLICGVLAVPLERLLRKSGIKTVAIAHGLDALWSFPPYQWTLERVFARLDAVVAVSAATGQACLDRGLDPAKLRVIPNGIDLKRFESRPRSRRDQGFLGGRSLPSEAFLLCSVGRQVRRKGFLWFVEEVMPLMPGNVHYWLAGEGPECDKIRQAGRRIGLEDRVALLGCLPEEELLELYRSADLFIMPNIPVEGTMEGFGVVMLEAGLSGLPTIASRIEGICDVIAEGVNGHLVESGDQRAFAAAIQRYYGQEHFLGEWHSAQFSTPSALAGRLSLKPMSISVEPFAFANRQ